MRNNIFIRGLVITLLITFICFSRGFCQNDIKAQLVSRIFKTIAKVFIYTADLEKMKKENIDRINKMDEENFRLRYLDFYEHIYDYKFMLDKYGLSGGLNKEEAIVKIKSLNKPKLYGIIDHLPDSIVFREVKKYLYRHKLIPQKKSELVGKIRQMIDHIKSKYLKVSY